MLLEAAEDAGPIGVSLADAAEDLGTDVVSVSATAPGSLVPVFTKRCTYGDKLASLTPSFFTQAKFSLRSAQYVADLGTFTTVATKDNVARQCATSLSFASTLLRCTIELAKIF